MRLTYKVWKKYSISQFSFKLVGFGSDEASKVQVVKMGVGKRLHEIHPEITLVKCLAHRMESSFKDAMKQNSQYEKVQTLLLGLYYLYKRSPKEGQRLIKTFSALDMIHLLPPRIGGGHILIMPFVSSFEATKLLSHSCNMPANRATMRNVKD